MHVLAEDVEGLLVAVEGGAHVLGRPGLGALATAPRDEGAGAELGGEVDVVGDLADGEAADVAVVVGEPTVAEHRVGEEVRRHHRHAEAGVGERLTELLDVRLALVRRAAEREHVVVVEADAVGAEVGEAEDGVGRFERRAHRRAEHVDPLPPDRPQTEGELVRGCRCVLVHRRRS